MSGELDAIATCGCAKCGAIIGENCRRKNKPTTHLHYAQTHAVRLDKAKRWPATIPAKHQHTVRVALWCLQDSCHKSGNEKGLRLAKQAMDELGLRDERAERYRESR
jgi:hypothetical protein